MSQLKALTVLNVGSNKLPSTDVDFIIESFPQLTKLYLYGLGLTGEYLCSISGPLTLLPAVLPDSIGQLQALKTLNLYNNALEGEHLRRTNLTPNSSVRRAARDFQPAHCHDRLQSERQQHRRYVLA